MKLDFNNKLEHTKNTPNQTKEFISELSNYLENFKERVNNFFKNNNERKEKVNNMQEEGLYYVISGNPEKVYLTKFKSNKVFEATDLPLEIKQAVSEGFILRYKDGKYSIDEELTDKNFEGELNIDEYQDT